MRFGRAHAAVAVVTIAAIGTGAATSGASPRARAAQCTIKNNIEAIIDDSGSMSGTDPRRLRVQAINQLTATPGNENKLLGAIEFGSDAEAIFSPARIGQFRNLMAAVLDQRIQANNGATNYNDAFALAGQHNPGADSRIFLTDGNPSSTYNEGHRGGPPTHVIGLFSFLGTEDRARLQRIAGETGGIFRQVRDAGDLQPAMTDVNAALNCNRGPVSYRTLFSRTGQTTTRALNIPRGVRSVTFNLSWSNPNDRFTVDRFRIRRGRRLVAASRHRKLRVTRRRGATFQVVKVSRVVRGRMRFRLRAVRVSTPGVRVRLTTQATRSRRR